MMKNIYFVAFLVLAGFLYSCEKTEPTRDKIEYNADRTKAPTINKDSDLDSVAVFVGDIYRLNLELEAANGIDSIFVNGSHEFPVGDGQLKYSNILEILMPNEDFHEVSIMVKDEIGLETTREFVLTKGVYKSPYIIADFPFSGTDVSFLTAGTSNKRRPYFPAYSDQADYSSKNFAWADAKVKSDISPDMRIRYGSPGFNGAGNVAPITPNINITDWPKLVGFGGTNAPAHIVDGETFALRLNLHPRKPNMRTMIIFDQPINQGLIGDVVDNKSRVIKIDVYVKTTADAAHPYAAGDWSPKLKPYGSIEHGATPDGTNNTFHTKVGLGMANVVKFHDRATSSPLRVRAGQDHGMVTIMTKKNEWETLTFAYNPLQATWAENEGKVFATGDVENDEVDMLILVVSPAGAANTSNATYYFRNLRIEEVVVTP